MAGDGKGRARPPGQEDASPGDGPSRLHSYEIGKYLAVGPKAGAGGPLLKELQRRGFRHVVDLNGGPEEQTDVTDSSVKYHAVRVTDEDGLPEWLSAMDRVVSIYRDAAARKEMSSSTAPTGWAAPPP